MTTYRHFVDRWPDLDDWFTAPLPLRLGFSGGTRHATGRTVAHRAQSYLIYLSLVRGVGLDWDLLLGRTYARMFSVAGGGRGLRFDHDLFGRNIERMVQLGYSRSAASTDLMWCLGRLVLHRGDPDHTAITDQDLAGLALAIRRFAARPDFDELRAAYFSGTDTAGGYSSVQFVRTQLAKLHSSHSLLFNIGQVHNPPHVGARRRPGWQDNLLPEPCPAKIRAVIQRYLTLRLHGHYDRPQTVRLAREALRRLVNWLVGNRPQLTSLAQLDRRTVEDYLQWLPTCVSQQTGQPLVRSTRANEISAIGAFCRDTATWGWVDVPGRPLLTRRDTPHRTKALPRFVPRHELDAIMSAVNDLPDPAQRTALLLLRWSGARRDEIRRLSCDCLDTDAAGNPRLRIPVGKGHSERIVPLHPDAAAALQTMIDLARSREAARRFDPNAGRPVDYVFVRRGKLMSASTLFDKPFQTVCAATGLVDDNGIATISAHRLRHTLGTELAEGGARLQTIMAILGHKSAEMSLIYARITDPEIRRQYEAALADGGRIAGPAADALLHHSMDSNAVHWLQTNFLKTELELGHCLRLPAEGPCECDLVLTCPKFVTSTEYIPRLRTRMEREEELIADAEDRGWPREAERHRCTQRRIGALLDQLNATP
jgi:integrase